MVHLEPLNVRIRVLEDISDERLHKTVFHTVHLNILSCDYYQRLIVLVKADRFGLLLVLPILIRLLWIFLRFEIPFGLQDLETVRITQERLSVDQYQMLVDFLVLFFVRDYSL